MEFPLLQLQRRRCEKHGGLGAQSRESRTAQREIQGLRVAEVWKTLEIPQKPKESVPGIVVGPSPALLPPKAMPGPKPSTSDHDSDDRKASTGPSSGAVAEEERKGSGKVGKAAAREAMDAKAVAEEARKERSRAKEVLAEEARKERSRAKEALADEARTLHAWAKKAAARLGLCEAVEANNVDALRVTINEGMKVALPAEDLEEAMEPLERKRSDAICGRFGSNAPRDPMPSAGVLDLRGRSSGSGAGRERTRSAAPKPSPSTSRARPVFSFRPASGAVAAQPATKPSTSRTSTPRATLSLARGVAPSVAVAPPICRFCPSPPVLRSPSPPGRLCPSPPVLRSPSPPGRLCPSPPVVRRKRKREP